MTVESATQEIFDLKKQHGNAVVKDNAQAQFGDITQHVNISGGLHVHVTQPLKSLTIAAVAVHALKLANHFHSISTSVVTGRVSRTKLHDFRKFTQSRARLDQSWRPHADELSLDETEVFKESDLKARLCRGSRNCKDPTHHTTTAAIRLSGLAQELAVDLLLGFVEQELGSYGNELNIYEDQESTREAENEVYAATVPGDYFPSKRAVRSTQHTHIRNALTSLQTFLYTIKPPLPFGAKYPVPAKDKTRATLNQYYAFMRSLQANINPQMTTLFNTLHQDTDRAAESSAGVENGDRVIEVVALNRLSDIGPETVAAILTMQDGSSKTIANQSFADTAIEDYRSSTVVRYDLLANATQADNYPAPVVAPNLAEWLQNVLAFHEEHDRYFEIRPAHAKTFSWILKKVVPPPQDHFCNWLENEYGLYWFNGKAGSGKSTLMKYVAQHHRLEPLLRRWAGPRNLLVAKFFFWHAGQPLQKSLEGVLRSVLRQILQARPDMIPIVFPRFSRYVALQSKSPKTAISVQELEDALLTFGRLIPKDLALFLMVDGVDEYKGHHLPFAKLLAKIANSKFVKVLVSSRPIPECYHVFSDYPQIKLQDLTRKDISEYIEDELMTDKLFIQMDRAEPGFGTSLRDTLVEKSSGVFLWIVLVVQKILIGLVHYEDRMTIMARVDHLPNDLETLYDHMFSNMDQEYQREGSLYMQLMSRAQEVQTTPLTALQFGVAAEYLRDLCDGHNDRELPLPDEPVFVEMLAGRLRSRCCGLIEIQDHDVRGKMSTPKITFLHRTVYDYLNNPVIWSKLTTIIDIPLANKNKSLLRACADLLEHWRLRARNIKHFKIPCCDTFVAAIQVAYASKCFGIGEYASMLFRAELNFQLLCRSASTYDSRDSNQLSAISYNDAWRESLTHPSMRAVAAISEISTDSDPDYVTLQVASQLGMSSYIRMYLQATPDSAHAAAVLLLKMFKRVEKRSCLCMWPRNMCVL